MKNKENNFGFFKADDVISWEVTKRGQNSMVEVSKQPDLLSGLPNEVLLP